MTEFWNYQFTDNPDFIETFDELPLWSASFGLFLLKHIDLKPDQTILDIGSGAGFPLFELAERLGPSCKCYGLDNWANANIRARKKIKNYGITNVEVLDGSANKIPFNDESIDLILSNLGINNFDNPSEVFAECKRVLKSDCKLVITTNLNGHWKEFYTIFEETLTRSGSRDIIGKLQEHQEHRGSVATISRLFTENNFQVSRHFEDKFEMRFLSGTAFLNHHFIKFGWLQSWQNIIPADEKATFFKQLEEDLNKYSEKNDGLTLTVPMAFIEGQKI